MPCLDDAPTAELTPAASPSKEDISPIPSQDAHPIPVTNIPGVGTCENSPVASNNSCEDRFLYGTVPSSWGAGSHWGAWGVFDVYSGSRTADLLEKQLLACVRHSPGKRCALLSMYDYFTSTLHVACIGDSRAVLGRKRPNGTWEAVLLPVHQTGHNPRELARLRRKDPGKEDNVTTNGRVRGMAASRSAGNGRWEWSLDLQRDPRLRLHSLRVLPPVYKAGTPPYRTAELTSTTIGNTDQPSFLIMGSNGLWGRLSSQQAVDMVGKWWDSGPPRKGDMEPEPTYDTVYYNQFRTLGSASPRYLRHHGLIAAQFVYIPPFPFILGDATLQVVFFGRYRAV
ncbi:pyruvate dehydrogenase [Chaetomium fimeti]|uniref:Pyruvate dehydrogenase n=1 Tax=Chaetomium fimeti TaxID=1854472 RepID=A0AAE0HAQ7_9PEZI|nr:pyruvate dehydrogenase [Chaetomium fimeti]